MFPWGGREGERFAGDQKFGSGDIKSLLIPVSFEYVPVSSSFFERKNWMRLKGGWREGIDR